MTAPLLAVEDLAVELAGAPRLAPLVDGVSFSLDAGRTLGLVGESGSGKTVTALSLLSLLPAQLRVARGAVRLRGEDLVRLDEARLRAVRGDRAAMIFQEPVSSLNPVHTIGDQVGEPLRIHRGATRRAARAAAVDLLAQVGIADPARRAGEYPHQLSGGMCQRAMIAMALACRPELLIADEPTTALDVTVQAQILDLLARLRREMGLAVLLITHDLGVVATSCDEVAVMYAGQIVERAPTAALLAGPRHPYTRGLLRALPSEPGAIAGEPPAGRPRLREIPGLPPDAGERAAGCRFASRCDRVEPRCRVEAPPLVEISAGRDVRCFFPVDAHEVEIDNTVAP